MSKARITPRRTQILKLMAKGYKDEQIGRIMNLHITNVKMQKSRLYNYLGVHTKKEALYVGLEKGLVDYSDFKTTPKEEKSPFIVRLEIKDKSQKTYRISEELFSEIKEKIKPYRSMQTMSKMVKCVETQEVFRCANEAAKTLRFRHITNSYSADVSIKMACKGKKDSAYGYHWEFVEK